jgi:outer membrane murein-binding lipoprotein Lpp
MLAEGTWTDSAVRTPLYYPAAVLRRCATNWEDTTGWSRHGGGAPRDITDKVAEIRNPRFEESAVVADVYLHGATQKSRDMIAMIDQGLVGFVSVEHRGQERYNPATRRLEAVDIAFDGFAFVNRGACTKCRLNEDSGAETPPNQEHNEEKKIMESDEIVQKLSELVSAVTELTARVKALESEFEAMPKTPSESTAESSGARESAAIAELRADIRALKARPVAPVTARSLGDTGTDDDDAVVELDCQYDGPGGRVLTYRGRA